MSFDSATPGCVIEYDGLGKVVFTKNKLARKLKITIRPFKPIRVTVPNRVSLKRAKSFFDSELIWVSKQRLRMVEYESWHCDYFNNCRLLDIDRARKELTSRIAQLAYSYGFRFGKVSVKLQKTIWGSCTAKNDINLNGYLLLLPTRLRDYVILHELTHTKVKNHGRQFWNEIEKILDNARDLDAQLKKYPLPI